MDSDFTIAIATLNVAPSGKYIEKAVVVSKLPLPAGELRPYLTQCSLCHQHSSPQTRTQSVPPFLQSIGARLTNTSCNRIIGQNSPHLMHSMQPNNMLRWTVPQSVTIKPTQTERVNLSITKYTKRCAFFLYLTSKYFLLVTPNKIPDADCPIIRTRGKFLIRGTKTANIQKRSTHSSM